MDLDNIKKVWQEQKTASFNKTEIIAMLQKKSSSVAKWIFYIGFGELLFWIGLSILLPENSLEKAQGSNLFFQICSAIFYITIVIFIGLFFRNYTKIKATQTTKELLQSIFTMRKTVHYYIIYNVSWALFTSIALIVWLWISDNPAIKIPEQAHNSPIFGIGLIVGITAFLGIIFTAFYFFYQLLYGFLLRRLKQNYAELKELQ